MSCSSTQSLTPAGDVTFPDRGARASLDRRAFGPPVLTALPVGSGDAPFLLGDSDGFPARRRRSLDARAHGPLPDRGCVEGDELVVDPAGLTADQALAVPIAGGRGVAMAGPVVGLIVAPGRPASPVSCAVADLAAVRRALLGTVATEGEPRLAVHRPSSARCTCSACRSCLRCAATSIARSLGRRSLSPARRPTPYVGLLPGGRTVAAVIHAGRLIAPTADGDPSTPTPIATLAGAEPIGLVGRRDRPRRSTTRRSARQPRTLGGGRWPFPPPLPLAWTSIVPFDLVRSPEADDGALDASARGAIRLDAGNDVAVGRGGLSAEVAAPPGSRVIVQ